MAKIPQNFNRRHPERQIGEVFIGNHATADFRKLPYATKRRGTAAYTSHGAIVPGVLPTFARRDEIEMHPNSKELIWQLYTNGVWVLRYNFNATHPELRDGELFLGNDSVRAFGKMPWQSKRLGNECYGPDGTLVVQGVRPIFVRRSELEGSPDGIQVLKILLRDGIP
jgi:hypothetical protein